jgi:hypothetical protein
MAKRKKRSATSRSAGKKRTPLKRRTAAKRGTAAKRRTATKPRTGAKRRSAANRRPPAKRSSAAKPRPLRKRDAAGTPVAQEETTPEETRSGLPPTQDTFATDVFERAVGKHSAKMALVEMLTDSPHLRLLMQEAEAIDASEFLANHIIELEESIAIVEAENAMLISEAQHRHSTLHEEALFAQPKQQTWRRSSRNLQDDLEGVDESNVVLMEASGPRRHHGDAKMNARADYLIQTMQNTDVVPDKQYLVETWSKIEN